MNSQNIPLYIPCTTVECHSHPYLLWRAKTLHHNIQSSAQPIILTPNTQSKQFLPKYVMLKLSLSAVYLSLVDGVHIKIFEQCWWCVRGRWEGGQQCSVTTSWWCCLEAHTFVCCKLHCCILTLLTHHHNYALTYWTQFYSICTNIPDSIFMC